MQRRTFLIGAATGTVLPGVSLVWPLPAAGANPGVPNGTGWPLAIPVPAQKPTQVYLIGTLGDDAGDRLAPDAAAWLARGVAVELIVLHPGEAATLADWDLAISQLNEAVAIEAHALACVAPGDTEDVIARIVTARA